MVECILITHPLGSWKEERVDGSSKNVMKEERGGGGEGGKWSYNVTMPLHEFPPATEYFIKYDNF